MCTGHDRDVDSLSGSSNSISVSPEDSDRRRTASGGKLGTALSSWGTSWKKGSQALKVSPDISIFEAFAIVKVKGAIN